MRRLDIGKSKKVEAQLITAEAQAEHFEELMKHKKTTFVTLTDEVEALIPDLPEEHWMRTYLQKAVHTVSENDELTDRERSKFIISMVKMLADLNESIMDPEKPEPAPPRSSMTGRPWPKKKKKSVDLKG